MNTSLFHAFKLLSAAGVIAGLMLIGVTESSAQQKAKTMKEQLVGTWTLVSADTVGKDGSKSPNFGPNPKGMLIFEANGRYSAMLMSSGRPKFASNNRAKGTPEENKAAVQGSIAFFGTYSVDEATKTLMSRVEGSTFPNSEGGVQKRTITRLTANEFKYINPATTTGETAEAVWKRVK